MPWLPLSDSAYRMKEKHGETSFSWYCVVAQLNHNNLLKRKREVDREWSLCSEASMRCHSIDLAVCSSDHDKPKIESKSLVHGLTSYHRESVAEKSLMARRINKSYQPNFACILATRMYLELALEF